MSVAAFFRSTGRFRRDERAVSAVEFAITMPFLIALFLGSMELTMAWAVKRKVVTLSKTLADMVSQSQTQITTSELDAILTAATPIMYPYPVTSTELTIKIYSIWNDANSQATILWSYPPVARNQGSTTVQFPQASIGVIRSDVTYKYVPRFGTALTGTVTMHEINEYNLRNPGSLTLP